MGGSAAVQLNTLQIYISRNLTSHLNRKKHPGSPEPKLSCRKPESQNLT
jgi:hypothetical protein